MENNNKQSTMKCPVCHTSNHVIKIVYGYPGQKILRDAEKGILKLGGYIIDPNNPQWYCKKDKIEF
jgi:hypothetical protein